jgi:hypothetical protein
VAAKERAEDGVLAAELREGGEADEESEGLVVSLSMEARGWKVPAGVCVFSGVGHADESCGVDASPTEVLVLELTAVYRPSSCPVSFRDVTSFDKDAIYQAVEGGRLVSQGWLGSYAKYSKAANSQMSEEYLRCKLQYFSHVFGV